MKISFLKYFLMITGVHIKIIPCPAPNLAFADIEQLCGRLYYFLFWFI